VRSGDDPEVDGTGATTRAAQLLAFVEARGLVLVHDRVLPSATAFVVGEPVAGSWWAHPMANVVFDAVERLEDVTATVKLLAGKDTLVARRWWPALAAIGAGREPWQLARLDEAARALLDDLERGGEPRLVERAERDAVARLEAALATVTTSVHTERGHHVRVVAPWTWWARERGLAWPPATSAAGARAELDALVSAWPGDANPARLLPWHDQPGPPRRGRRPRRADG
jgi:hypothetical protein